VYIDFLTGGVIRGLSHFFPPCGKTMMKWFLKCRLVSPTYNHFLQNRVFKDAKYNKVHEYEHIKCR